MEKVKSAVSAHKSTIIDFVIDTICFTIGWIATIFAIKLLIKGGLVQVALLILMAIPSYLIGEKLSRMIKANK
tara:strand:- start:551 stop:769 length:219 start_codon:yes stop_codon:yes gene_type:complete